MNRHYLRWILAASISLPVFLLANRIARAQAPACWGPPESPISHGACTGCQSNACPLCSEAHGERGPSCNPGTSQDCQPYYAWRLVLGSGFYTAVQDVPCSYIHTCTPPLDCRLGPCFPIGNTPSETTFSDLRITGECP
jgi:hypothetical protein